MRAFVLIAAVALPACSTTPRLTEAHRSEVEFAAGWNEIANVSGDANAEFAGEILFGYMLTDWAEIGALFAGAHGEVDAKQQVGNSGRFDVDQGLEVTDFTSGPVLRLNLPTHTPVVPFAEAAIGFGSARVEGEQSTNNISVRVESDEYLWFYQFGAGVRWFVTDDVAIVGLGRYRWLDISDVSGTLESVQAMLGLSLTF